MLILSTQTKNEVRYLEYVLVRVHQRNKTIRMCTYIERNYKELIHVMMEAGKSKICCAGWQSRDPGKLMQIQCKEANSPETLTLLPPY